MLFFLQFDVIALLLLQNGNVAELLLNDGFARCVDWSIAMVTGGAEKLRAAEKAAKEKKLRIWKNYVPAGPQVNDRFSLANYLAA